MNNLPASLHGCIATAVKLVPCCLLMSVLVVETGCVSQRAYEQARNEADALTRSLSVTRAEMTELGQHIGELEADNQEQDAAADELRASVQREVELLPILRRRANEKLMQLHTQVAHLVSQSRGLAKKIRDARKESVSLKLLAAQYKEEMEEARAYENITAPPLLVTPSGPAAPPPQAEPPSTPSLTTPNPVTPPQQMAQVTPVTPAKPPAPPRPAEPAPAPIEESWFDMIMNWLVGVWNWISSLFS